MTPRRVGRPGLLATMARIAAAAGADTAVSRGMRRAANAHAEERAASRVYHAQRNPAAALPISTSEDLYAKLEQLGDLHDSGVLTDDEFAAAKAKLLA
jgi:hypothetical protein